MGSRADQHYSKLHMSCRNHVHVHGLFLDCFSKYPNFIYINRKKRKMGRGVKIYVWGTGKDLKKDLFIVLNLLPGEE